MKPTQTILIATLTCGTSFAETLKAEGSEWDFLLHSEGDTPIDPAANDPDFHSTWHSPVANSYDGPAFRTGTGYFGYGGINARDIITNVWNPDGTKSDDRPESGLRNAVVYFRTTIIPTEANSFLRFRGVIDDGIIIFINGVQSGIINAESVPPGEESWLQESSNGDEDSLSEISIPFDAPLNQPIEIGISLHNTSDSSSDIGFDVEIESVTPITAPNDDFTDAIELSGAFPIEVIADNSNQAGNPGASLEDGEPNHANSSGQHSIWYHWTAPQDGRVSLSGFSGSFDPILAVYTGDSVDGLSPVSQFRDYDLPAASIQGEEDFFQEAYLEFNAAANETYYFAIDGADGLFGSFTLLMTGGVVPFDASGELLAANSDWNYLLAVDDTNQPIDPASVDPDFFTSWQTTDNYDGPAFSEPAPAPIGYGSINAANMATDLWGGLDHDGDSIPDDEPPSELRYAAYFKTTFTPATTVTSVGLEVLADDGAVVYFNGIEAARLGIDPFSLLNNWQEAAISLTGTSGFDTESGPHHALVTGLNLPAGQPVEVAVSLHNRTATSSDLGLDMRIYQVGGPPATPAFDLELIPQADGSFILRWNSEEGIKYRVEQNEDLFGDWRSIIGDSVTGNNTGINQLNIPVNLSKNFLRVVRLLE